MTSDSAVDGPALLDDPADLRRSDYVAALKRTLAEVKADDVPSLAAGVAFRMFLSLFPALIAAVAIFSLVVDPAELRALIDQIGAVVPRQAADLIRDQLEKLASDAGAGAGAAAVTGVLVGLFAATSAAVALMKALSRAYDVAETRKLVRQRLVALVLVLALLVALGALVALLVLGPQLQSALIGDLVPPLSVLFAVARGLLALVVLAVLFAFVYWIGPNREHPSWVWMSPGAALAVIGWLVVAAGFTLYAQTADSYAATYGVFAGVAVLLIWLQLSFLVLLVGAEFNAEIERTRGTYGAVGEGAGFAAPAGAAALVPPDPESGRAGVTEGVVAASGREPSQDSDQAFEISLPPPPAAPLAPVSPDPTGTTGVARGPRAQRRPKVGTVTAAAMAAAVFLGFARRRRD